MTTNPYTPPLSSFNANNEQDVSISLWNPNAAVIWSILIGPAFGAILHMKNWQALGEPAKAKRVRTWAVLSLIILFGTPIVANLFRESKIFLTLLSWSEYPFLLLWYFSEAREQSQYVATKFRKNYPRARWGKPILVALGVILASASLG